MNKVVLIGNLTKNVDFQTTTNNINFCRFTLAVQRRFVNSEGDREADFINILAWRNLAETCNKFLSKGKKIAVVGALQTRSYDAQDGTKRYVTEVVADEIEFLSPKSNEETSEATPKETNELEPIGDDILPF